MSPGTRKLVSDKSTLTPEELMNMPHARMLKFEELLAKLASPDSGNSLSWSPRLSLFTDGERKYPLKNGMPLLLPERLQKYFTDRLSVPFSSSYDPFMQYFLMASIKQFGEINASSEDVHYQRHLFRMRKACHSCSGYVLDIGCDDPAIGAGLLPENAFYVGLDPFCLQSEKFRLVGVGELLPFQNGSFDCVVYNTSLDHMLDWRQSLGEAIRVLSPGGRIVISTLVWVDRAGLISDSVHFHHFREYEIMGALSDLNVEEIWHYDYKGDSHRYGLYLTATKIAEGS